MYLSSLNSKFNWNLKKEIIKAVETEISSDCVEKELVFNKRTCSFGGTQLR